MTEYVWYNDTIGFGCASVKTEGRKLSPIDYLLFNGVYPNPSVYDASELEQLKNEGWYYKTPCYTRHSSKART
jgi:hypothetical protein